MPTPLKVRALWHMHRTPLAGVVKRAMRASRASACERRRSLAAQLPHDAATREAARLIQTQGYARLDSIVDPALLQALGQHGASKLERAAALAKSQATTHKSFWVRLSDEDVAGGQFDLGNPMVKYALQPRVLAVIAAALGELPQLSDVLLSLSEPTTEDLKYSQLWHRDYDDVRTIKFFAYLTDVQSEADGPFTFIPGPESDTHRFSMRTHMRDDEVFRGVRRDAVQSLVAPRLSTFAVETSRCLHMGSRLAPGHLRLLYTATFIQFPRVYPEPPLRFRLDDHLDPVNRAVLVPA
jgi:hypothetical protein